LYFSLFSKIVFFFFFAFLCFFSKLFLSILFF
jgi:hypothetical protein